MAATEEEYLKISVDNIPKSLLFDTITLIRGVSGRDAKPSDVLRLSLRLTFSIISTLYKRQDKEKKVSRLITIANKTYKAIYTSVQTLRKVALTEDAWMKNTSLDEARRLAREAWSRKLKRGDAVTMIALIEGMRELTDEEYHQFLDGVEKELATIPVKPDGRGMH